MELILNGIHGTRELNSLIEMNDDDDFPAFKYQRHEKNEERDRKGLCISNFFK